MKFTLHWLKDYLDTSASAQEISIGLTNLGLEVEALEDIGATLAPFIVAKIESAEPHPDADKLRVCRVNDGSTVRQIVCGAPNARAGIYVVLATEGVCIPANGMKIKQAKIRGVESNGMLCSLAELGMAGDSDGIIELTGEPALGSSAAEALGMNDVVFEIAITPNRGDCFGIYGVARDLAAAGFGALREAVIPHAPLVPLGTKPSVVTAATNTALCSHFVGLTVSGVKNTHSPDWLRQRLEMVGQKPISALVDITNYIMLTFGRPLHAYDTRQLHGAVTAREATAGESFTALNGEEYKLDAGMLIIADDKKILGLAGIMGSEGSGCQLDTTDVFIESALFDAVSIAQTGQKLNLTSDARMRFERGVDGAFAEQGAQLAASLIVALCGGEVSAFTSAGSAASKPDLLAFSPSSVSQITSLDVAADRSKEILVSLGFGVDESAETWTVVAPSWRHDISVAQDLVEEIARIVGYNNIAPLSLPSSASIAPKVRDRLAIARQLLASQGLVELHSWTFVSEAQARDVGEVNPSLALTNPISSDLSMMRSSLLPHLLGSAQRNLNKGVKQIAVFEAGQVFSGTAYNDQHAMVAGLLAGKQPKFTHGSEQFAAAQTSYSVYDAKAYALSLLGAYGVNIDQLSITTDVPDYFHPGRSMRMSLGGKVTLGYAGELHPALLEKHDVDGVVAYFEVSVDNVPMPKQKATAKKPLQLSPYPSVDRDFAFTVAEAVAVEDIRRAALRADKKLIKSAEIFDVYQGKHMDAGQKSVALRVTLESMEATLNDEQITQLSDAVVSQVGSATGATLRQ